MKKLTIDSKIKDVLENPVGRDVIDKILLQMDKPEWLVDNIAIRELKLKSLNRLIKDETFLVDLLHLLNQEQDRPIQSGGELSVAWWKEIVFYQIYPRSFKDSNGDGFGDIPGILEKLDYIQAMGFKGIWLSPIFDSPMKDNGYDISDYYGLHPQMGTMQDLIDLIEQSHKRGIKIVLDLVVNHTSDQHPWFKEALENPQSEKRDYYFFRDPQDINNWVSFFYEGAWKEFKEQNVSALHLFASEQFDLNWNNPKVRDEVVNIIDFYGQLGIDGFRLDVINYISKNPGLPNGNQWVGDLMEFTGIEHYFYGPHLHDYLKEIQERGFEPHDMFSIGETPGIGIQMGKLLSADYRKELDLIFNFDHLETPGHTRYDDYVYDLNYYKNYILKWTKSLSQHDWMSLFMENHDNPRMTSKVNRDERYNSRVSKLLGTLLLTLKGTPFIFQGQELGAINQEFTIDELRDVESLNKLKLSSLEDVLHGSRDHSRTMMKWDDQVIQNAWIKGQHPSIQSIKEQEDESNSVLNYYKDVIKLRNENLDFIYSDVQFFGESKKDYFGYRRGNFYVEVNLSNKWINRKKVPFTTKRLLSNVDEHRRVHLQPFEANIYRIIEGE